MRSSWIRILGVGLTVLVVAGCGSDKPSRSQFQTDVQQTRDRVDFNLASITEAQSREQLLDEMEKAAGSIDDAADDLDGKGTPKEFADEADELVKGLHQLATDLASTAAQVREPGFENLLNGARGLSFDSWDHVNLILAKLRAQGIKVAPLARH